MQEAILARQILRRQAIGHNPVSVTSDIERGAELSDSPVHCSRVIEFEASEPFHDYSIDLPPEFVSYHKLQRPYLSGSFAISGEISISEAADIDFLVSYGMALSGIACDDVDETILDRSRSDQREVLARLDDAKSDFSRETYDRLKKRFESLYEPDDENETRISAGSFRHFIRFLRADRRFRCPSVVITDRGNVKAIWQASSSEIFWIEFESNGDVTYLAFFPNKKRSDGIERVSALSTVDDVMKRAAATGATKWMRR